MPRQARLDAPGLVHHVMARGIEDQRIFRDNKDREGFLVRLAEIVASSVGANLYAWAQVTGRPAHRPKGPGATTGTTSFSPTTAPFSPTTQTATR